MSRVGIIGLGNMGFAIYESIKNRFETIFFDPYKKEIGKSAESIDALSQASDIILLCVKPDKIIEVVKEIHSPKILISVAAGISLETLKSHSVIGSKIVRVMPNLPLTVGEGLVAYTGEREVYPVVKEIFRNSGMTLELGSEKLIDAVTGLSGSGPAFVFSFIQALAEGGVKSGLTYSDSLRAAVQTVKGSTKLLENELEKNSNTHPYELRNKVTSPAGTTIFGLDALEKGRFSHSVIQAVYKAFLRAKELGKS